LQSRISGNREKEAVVFPAPLQPATMYNLALIQQVYSEK
jgi:hypothetical protein